MDDLDRAQLLEEAERDAALQRVLNRTQTESPKVTFLGVRICIDCEEPIGRNRLKAKPDAVRCIDCETINEKKHHGR